MTQGDKAQDLYRKYKQTGTHRFDVATDVRRLSFLMGGSYRVDRKRNPWREERDEDEKVKEEAQLNDADSSGCIHTSSHVEYFDRLSKWLTSQALGKPINAAMVYF